MLNFQGYTPEISRFLLRLHGCPASGADLCGASMSRQVRFAYDMIWQIAIDDAARR
jgi:hypothetical protein